LGSILHAVVNDPRLDGLVVSSHQQRLGRDTGEPSMLAERLTAQLLAGPPAGDPAAVAERLLAIQAQDARGARLAVRARTTGLSAADVDRELTEHRSLVISWLNRGTLHIVGSEDYWWLQALTTPPVFTGNARRLAQEGVPSDAAERGVAIIERSLAEEGPLTRQQLGERIGATGVRTKGQALVHLLMLACLRRLAVRGPMIGGRHAYVLVRDWLGEPPPVDRDRALAELARRYLAGHGPADDRDLAKWAGLPLRDARAGLKAIASELDERENGLVDLVRRPPAAELPPPRLLGPFEPVLLGWRSREPLVGPHEAVIVGNGLFRPFVLVRGRAAAIWRMPGGEVVLAPFGPLAPEVAAALEADAKDVARYLFAGASGKNAD
jgi:Winged helix DNA-binding domain